MARKGHTAPRGASRGGPRGLMPALGAAFVGVLLLGVIVFRALTGLIHDRAEADAEALLAQSEATIEGWLGQYRALPPLYARDPRVVAAMKGAPRPGDLDALGRELAEWNRIARTSDTYVMAPDGTTVAASNYAEELSFVGRNFGFRPYFQEAMDGAPASFFALGTTSGLRGYYLSAPIRDGAGGEVLGVVVVKVSIAALEAVLGEGAHPVFVSDEAGVVIFATQPGLRLTALEEIPPEARARVEETRKYELEHIGPAPLEGQSGGGWGAPLLRAPGIGEGSAPQSYLSHERPMAAEGWQLHLLYDYAPVRQQVWTLAAALIAAGIALTALAALGLQRRARLIQRLADREQNQQELERRVARRTAELTEANRQLQVEVEDRRTAEETLRQTQNELIQAGKLAALGQMSAALSHEFNQPLTAIRTYSENAAAFYEAGKADRAAENIARVLRLTERMAQLSKRLTRFARRSGDDVVAVDLDSVLSEALALIAARVERSGARIEISGRRGLWVAGGATRLQHVVMNLVGNALDAVPTGRAPEVTITLTEDAGQVAMTVEDNGTGIPEEALPKIFDPFFTTKEVGRGLGLGLSICYNILRDFGGTMRAENRAGHGARIIVTLKQATDRQMAAE